MLLLLASHTVMGLCISFGKDSAGGLNDEEKTRSNTVETLTGGRPPPSLFLVEEFRGSLTMGSLVLPPGWEAWPIVDA
jgi:hypothetical protein